MTFADSAKFGKEIATKINECGGEAFVEKN